MKEKIVLKSVNPEEYGDIEVECRVLERADIPAYIDTIPETEKFMGVKVAPVAARLATPGEVIHTTLTTEIGGRLYMLSEESNTAREGDYVVTNVGSTSNEQYIVRGEKFAKTYEANADGTFTPVPDPRMLTRVPENIMFTTSWGAPAICLAGSYLVTYGPTSFNTLEKDAYAKTYKPYVPTVPQKS